MTKKLSFSLILNLILKLIAVGLGIFINRWLNLHVEPGQLAQYNLITASLIPTIIALIDFGIPSLVQKHYTNSQKDVEYLAQVWTTFSVLRLATYVIGFIIVISSFRLVTSDLWLVTAIFSTMFILRLDENYRSVCSAFGHIWQFACTDFVSKIFIVGVIFLLSPIFIRDSVSSIWFFVTTNLIAALMGLGIDSIWQRKFTRLGAFSWQILRSNIKNIAYLSLTSVVVATFWNTDKLIISFFGATSFEINAYVNAFSIYDRLGIIAGVTVPTLSSLVKGQLQSQGYPWSKLLKWLMAVSLAGICLAIGLWILAAPFIWLIDPQLKYAQAIQILPIFGVALAILFPTLLVRDLLIFYHGEKWEFISAIAAALLFLSLYALLIPQYSIFGAAIATSLGYVLSFLLKTTFLILQIRQQATSPSVPVQSPG